LLNELFELSNVISEVELKVDNWHREYNPLPNIPCYRIWISADGAVCGCEELNPELISLLRKYGNYQRSFPAFNIKPLYRIVDEAQKKQLKRYESDISSFDFETVRSWCVQDNWHRNLKSIDKSLRDLGRKISSIISDQGLDQWNIITQLALATEKMDGGLKKSLERYIFEKLSKGEDIELLLKLLFHIGDPSKNPEEDNGKNLSIILDLKNWQDFNNPVASEQTTRWLNEVLLKGEEQEKLNVSFLSPTKDAFGTQHDGVLDPMPKVRLHGFDVSLRAMFREQLCQYRYRTIDSNSFPISKINRAKLKQSLEWIAMQDNEGIYWKKADDKEIVFVYPSKLPPIPLKFASFFGEPDDANDDVEKRFGSIAKDFIRTLEGVPLKERPDSIQVFSIRKMDKARSKVVFTHNLTPDHLIHSAEEWQNGCGNLPEIESVERMVPFPLQIARVVNNVWMQNGELANAGKAVKRMQYYQGMELLLNPPREDEIRYYLHILISNSSGLVMNFGNESHNRYAPRIVGKKAKSIKQVELSRLLPVFGLLLYKNGIRADEYMENAPYLVGQFLRVSDELHAFYCKVVRGGDLPTQLAGNSVFMYASEMPAQALAQLGARMMPYISWAKQYRSKNITDVGSESWRAAWYLAMYEDITTRLHQELKESTRFNDFQKAQMFIGYLAKFPKRGQNQKEDAIATD
jgi:hypothetical protein